MYGAKDSVSINHESEFLLSSSNFLQKGTGVRRPLGLVLVVTAIAFRSLGLIALGVYEASRHLVGPVLECGVAVCSLALGILAISLWRTKNWARIITIAVALAGVVGQAVVATLAAGSHIPSWWVGPPVLLDFCVNLVICCYLLAPSARRIFLPARAGGRPY